MVLYNLTSSTLNTSLSNCLVLKFPLTTSKIYLEIIYSSPMVILSMTQLRSEATTKTHQELFVCTIFIMKECIQNSIFSTGNRVNLSSSIDKTVHPPLNLHNIHLHCKSDYHQHYTHLISLHNYIMNWRILLNHASLPPSLDYNSPRTGTSWILSCTLTLLRPSSSMSRPASSASA